MLIKCLASESYDGGGGGDNDDDHKDFPEFLSQNLRDRQGLCVKTHLSCGEAADVNRCLEA